MLFESVLRLAQQKHYWSPSRLSRVLWRIFVYFPKQLEIIRILSRPVYASLIQTNPRIPFKYLTLNYLARGLTVTERASCFAHHYKRLHAAIPGHFLRQILLGEVVLEELRKDGHCFAIKFGQSRPIDREGELSLNLEVDGEIVFVLSFTIVPGWIVESEAEDVLLLTRLQGVKGRYKEIYLATRTLYDTAPAALLVAALSGVAQVFGIEKLAGVSAATQLTYSEDLSKEFKQAYDDFFVELGATRITRRFFARSLPLPEKPLVAIKKGHKTRTRAKRAFKLQIADSVCQQLRAKC